MYWFYAIAGSATLFWFSIQSERNAVQRRADRLRLRDQVELIVWREALPNVPDSVLKQSLSLLERAIKVPGDYLHPDDSFDEELALADRFWCLIIDDDTVEELCDHIEDMCGARPRGNWENLRSVVKEAWSMSIDEAKTTPVRALES